MRHAFSLLSGFGTARRANATQKGKERSWASLLLCCSLWYHLVRRSSLESPLFFSALLWQLAFGIVVVPDLNFLRIMN